MTTFNQLRAQGIPYSTLIKAIRAHCILYHGTHADKWYDAKQVELIKNYAANERKRKARVER